MEAVVARRARYRSWLLAVLGAVCGLAMWSAQAVADSPLTWSAPTTIDSPNVLYGVSCPSSALCVAVDGAGQAVTATTPVAGPWTVTPIEGTSSYALNAVSCPSTSLCVTSANGNMLSSTTPTAAGAWTKTNVGTTASAISCPSTSLCVAVDAAGNVTNSTNPGAATPTWSTLAHIDNKRAVRSLVPGRGAVRGDRRGRQRPHLHRSDQQQRVDEDER